MSRTATKEEEEEEEEEESHGSRSRLSSGASENVRTTEALVLQVPGIRAR
jgi:hypothetical protein